MTSDVNRVSQQPPLRQAQTALTEQRIIAAATDLFLTDGYVATTLEAVAKRAQVGARTVAERIAAHAAAGRQIMARTGALFAVAQQAAAIEPLIAGFWQQGREQSRHAHAVFWTRMADDGLLDPSIDLPWLIDTTSIIAAAETYLLITRMIGWDLDAYQNWLATTWTRLAGFRSADRSTTSLTGSTG